MTPKFHTKIIPIMLMIIFVILKNQLYAQKLISDSLKIEFPKLDSSQTIQVSIDTIIDNREVNPNVIGISETTQYLFIPVDLIIHSNDILSKEIFNIIPENKNMSPDSKLKLTIDEFKISKNTNSLIYPYYNLNASIKLQLSSSTDVNNYLGHLLYDTSIRKPFFKDKLKNGYEKVLVEWQQEFIEDLSHISITENSFKLDRDNFRKKAPNTKNMNMYCNLNTIIGVHNKIIDLEIFFSQLEAGKKFFRSGGHHVRYRNADQFESIEFGISNDYLHYRLKHQYLFRFNSQIMMGVNRWKNLNTTKHKIWDALIIDYSLSQTAQFNPIDKRSIILGIGLQQNVYYVYSKNVQFDFGILFQLGMKL